MWRSSDPDLSSASICAVSATLPSSASISAHNERASRISRAAEYALAIARRRLTGVFLHAHHERRAHAVDHRVGHRGGDDLALQAMALHVRGVLVLQRHREVAHELLRQVRIFRYVRIEQLLEQFDLRRTTAASDSSGRVMPDTARLALDQLRFATAGSRSGDRAGPSLSSMRMKCAFEPRRCTDMVLHQRDGLVLAVVVAQHQLADFVGHRGELLVARVVGQLTTLHRIVQQDLDVDLVIGRIDTGRVVDEVGIEQHAMLRSLDATLLGEAEIAALADHLAAQFLAIDAQRVVGAIAHVGMRLGARPSRRCRCRRSRADRPAP